MKLKTSVACRYCGELKVPGGALVGHERACADGGSKRRRRSRYREMFFANNGPGPYSCFFCKEKVVFDEVIIHHINHDETDNNLKNLTPCHRTCHNGYHFKELWSERREEFLASPTRGNRKPHSEETKKKISETKKRLGQQPTPEARKKASETRWGIKSKGGGAL